MQRLFYYSGTAGRQGCGNRKEENLVYNQNRAELLAPAGSFESMKAAIAAGADAVYMGGSRFGARAYADNPDEEKFLEAIDYAHLHGCRLYMTVNTLVKEGELKELFRYLAPFYERGLDAVIVQDLGVLSFIKNHFPGLPIHASTQMTITGVYGAKALVQMGAERIVTARELSLEEIRKIHQEVPVEIESFVHGALCYCYSGQCLMSSLIGGRSGNRGRCAQPCRLPYEVKRGSRTLNSKKESYVLNLKDLCTLDLIPDMLEAGVYSMKIEGRMKSPRYTAGVVSVYRKYLDRYLKNGRKGWKVDPEDKRLLLDLFDRGGFSEGYYRQHNGRNMVALGEKPAFRQVNQRLFEELDRNYVQKEKQEPVSGVLTLREGEPASLALTCTTGGRTVSARAEGTAAEKAQNQPLTAEKAEKQIKKTGGTPFSFEKLQTELGGNVFVPVQALNELRRNALDGLEREILNLYARQPASEKAALIEKKREIVKREPGEQKADETFRLAVSAETPEQLQAVLSQGKLAGDTGEPQTTGGMVLSEIAIDSGGFPGDMWREAAAAIHEKGLACCLILPHIFREEAIGYFERNLDRLKAAGFDGIIVRSLEEPVWLREKGISLPQFFDDTMYSWNHLALTEMRRMGAERITVPLELNSREIEAVYQGDLNAELVIYGHLPMMVSAQCVKKTVSGCDGRPEILKMKDRTGKFLPVKNQCVFCCNTIYNPSPLSLLQEEKAVRSLGIRNLRMKFTVENGEQAGTILTAFLDRWNEGGELRGDSGIFRDFTRGHFRRGVE